MNCSVPLGGSFVFWLCVQITPLTVSAQAEEVPELGEIRVQLKWLHQFQFAGYYAALEQGYYEERGLEVTLLEGEPELDPAEAVLSGKAEYGVATPELLLDYAEGEPLLALGVIFQHSPYVFLATESSGITDINLLAGKRVMIEPQAAELYAYLKRERVPVDSLTIVPHSLNAKALLDGEVDAMSAYSTDEEFTLEEAGVAYFAFSPRSAGVDFYGDLFFTTKAERTNNPERVRAFYEATIEGWQYALNHTDEVIDLILEKYPTLKTRQALVFEAAQMRQLMHPELIPVGYMYEGRWQHIAETYVELGMLNELPSLDGFLYQTKRKPDYSWALWTTGVTLAIAVVAFGVLLPVWRLNGKLRQEIDQRRKTEAQLNEAKTTAERAIEAKAQFFSSVTHDLRTPLNAILGISEVMLEEETDPEKEDHLRTINKAGINLLTLIDELLNLNRIESGRITMAIKPFLLDEVLDDVTELLRVPAQRKNIGLFCTIAPNLSGHLLGDKERLRQILFNLCGNAVKFTDKGSVKITASVDDQGWLLLRVLDSGSGIPDEIADKLFEPFVRSEQAKNKEGTGLGLSIVRRLAEAMGGKVTLKQKFEEGACFDVLLPIIDPNPDPDAIDLSRALGGQHVAVSIGDELLHQMISQNLVSLGATVTPYADEAETEYTLIVTNSSEQSREISQMHNGVPVILIANNYPPYTRRTLLNQVLAGKNQSLVQKVTSLK